LLVVVGAKFYPTHKLTTGHCAKKRQKYASDYPFFLFSGQNSMFFWSSFKELVNAVQNMPRPSFKQGVTLEKPSFLSDCGEFGLYVVQSLLSSFALHCLQRLERGLPPERL
jgi:hypothetical protein